MFYTIDRYLCTNQINCIQVSSYSKILDITYNEDNQFSILVESNSNDFIKDVYIYVANDFCLNVVPHNFKYLKTVEFNEIIPQIIRYTEHTISELINKHTKFYVFIDYNETLQEKRDRLINKVINS
ncbi:MAG: hypothetical protein M0R46_10505 [Candidatus Muirbacterium halophilum]|nr:hypothetical protein [Candidatus Muirbacterium halophilum]